MLFEYFAKDGFVVKIRSMLFENLVGRWWIWVRKEEEVISMTSCWMSLSWAPGRILWSVQSMSGQLKSPTSRISFSKAPSLVILLSDFSSSLGELVAEAQMIAFWKDNSKTEVRPVGIGCT